MGSALIGKQVPEFLAKAVHNGKIIENFSLKNFPEKYIILFFYPLDFTFVCPTELHAFQDSLSDFEKRNSQVIGCSIDSVYSHLAWLDTPKTLGGIQGITYPIISDLNKTITRDFGVLKEDEGIAYRGLFLIDKKRFVRHLLINDLPIGRSIEEAIRVLDALIFYETHGEVCPANWKKGSKSMKPTPTGLHIYFSVKKS
jgi:peroxiredoxin 2/4